MIPNFQKGSKGIVLPVLLQELGCRQFSLILCPVFIGAWERMEKIRVQMIAMKQGMSTKLDKIYGRTLSNNGIYILDKLNA